jgi:hypothetical protein
MNMDPKTVEKLEDKIEKPVAGIIVKMGLKRLPLLPSRHTMHLMGEAAKAPSDDQQPGARRPDEHRTEP